MEKWKKLNGLVIEHHQHKAHFFRCVLDGALNGAGGWFFLSCRYFWMCSSLPSATKMAHFLCIWFLTALEYYRILTPCRAWGVQERGSLIFPYGFLEPPPLEPRKVLPNKLHRKHRGIHIHLKAARKPQQLRWVFLLGKTQRPNTFPWYSGCSGQCCGCMVWSLRPGRICWRPRSTCTFTGQQGIKWINPSTN